MGRASKKVLDASLRAIPTARTLWVFVNTKPEFIVFISNATIFPGNQSI